MPATFFDSTMCGGGRVRRVMTLDSGLVRNRVAGFLPQAHSILVLVNSTLHGGTQGDVAVFTTEAGWEDTALHEYGHVLGLADEYGCYVCDGTDGGRTYDWFDAIVQGLRTAGPAECHAGGQSGGAEVGSMVASTTPVPTTPGSVPAGTVGMFESAKYYDLGLFRPEEFCAMRTTGAPFCAVCRAAITTALAPWTPTTTCVTPTATPASLTLDARIRGKVMISAGRGGYEVTLDTTTNLPATPAWTYRLDSGAWTAMPATRTIQVPINQNPGTYVYNHSAEVRATVTVEDLDYWVPATSAFTTAQATDPIALRQPNNAANRIVSDYGTPAMSGAPASASINFGGLAAGNGWLYLGTQMTTRGSPPAAARRRLLRSGRQPRVGAAERHLDPEPKPESGVTAFYDVTFGRQRPVLAEQRPGDEGGPRRRLRDLATGKDAIGQSFSVTGRLIPTNLEYRRSISTIQIAGSRNGSGRCDSRLRRMS